MSEKPPVEIAVEVTAENFPTAFALLEQFSLAVGKDAANYASKLPLPPGLQRHAFFGCCVGLCREAIMQCEIGAEFYEGQMGPRATVDHVAQDEDGVRTPLVSPTTRYTDIVPHDPA